LCVDAREHVHVRAAVPPLSRSLFDSPDVARAGTHARVLSRAQSLRPSRSADWGACRPPPVSRAPTAANRKPSSAAPMCRSPVGGSPQSLGKVGPPLVARGPSARLGTGPTPTTSAPGLGSVLPHLHLDWAHPCRTCAGTGLNPTTSTPGLGSFPLHLQRNWKWPGAQGIELPAEDEMKAPQLTDSSDVLTQGVSRSPGADVAGVSPSPVADVAAVSPVPV
jgi:hypothetical protein